MNIGKSKRTYGQAVIYNILHRATWTSLKNGGQLILVFYK